MKRLRKIGLVTVLLIAGSQVVAQKKADFSNIPIIAPIVVPQIATEGATSSSLDSAKTAFGKVFNKKTANAFVKNVKKNSKKAAVFCKKHKKYLLGLALVGASSYIVYKIVKSCSKKKTRTESCA